MSMLHTIVIGAATVLTFGRPAGVAATPIAVTGSIATAASAAAPAVRLSISPCATGSLDISLENVDGSGFLGGYGAAVVFTNTTTIPCTLTGFPTLEFHAASGSQIGSPLSGSDVAAPTVIVPPAAAAHADLLIRFAGNFGCPDRTATRVLVTPPGDTVGSSVSFRVDVCTDPPLENLELRAILPGQPTA
jgi:hypothetical protein